MESKVCEYCGKALIPAPARFDGEETFVGYLPHSCTQPPANAKGEENGDDWKSVLEEIDYYLSRVIYEKGKPTYGNNIGANSIIHKKVKQILAASQPPAGEQENKKLREALEKIKNSGLRPGECEACGEGSSVAAMQHSPSAKQELSNLITIKI